MIYGRLLNSGVLGSLGRVVFIRVHCFRILGLRVLGIRCFIGASAGSKDWVVLPAGATRHMFSSVSVSIVFECSFLLLRCLSCSFPFRASVRGSYKPYKAA